MMFSGDPGAVLAQLFFAVVDAFALTVLVFLRRRFGERFFNLSRFGMGVGILAFLIMLRSLAGALLGALPMFMGMFGVPPLLGFLAGPMLAPHRYAPPPHALFDAASALYWAFILVGGAQLIAVWLRSWRPGDSVPVHSKSAGEPLLSFGGRINHWLTIIFLEPIAVMLLGFFLHACDETLPFTYFVVLALFLAASATHQYRLYRDDMLDEQDARILAGFYAAQMKHVAAGNKPTMRLGKLFMPFVLPRGQKLQLEVLRNWAARHHAAANDTEPVTTAEARASEQTPPAPPDAA
jgi:hypothetical protein